VKPDEIKKFVISCLSVLAAGFAGSFFVSHSSGWYEALKKPVFTPPAWVFGPVWTVLYLLMGIALFLVWRKGVSSAAGKTAIAAFILQMVLNVIWTPIFFGLKLPLIAFGDIVMLWLAVITTILSFWKVSRPAAILLLPYIIWVSFAAILNVSFCLLNQ
jgi:benzodiazapine receptor